MGSQHPMSWKFVGEPDQSPWRITDLVGKSSAALVDFPMLLPVYLCVTSVISLFIYFFLRHVSVCCDTFVMNDRCGVSRDRQNRPEKGPAW